MSVILLLIILALIGGAAAVILWCFPGIPAPIKRLIIVVAVVVCVALVLHAFGIWDALLNVDVPKVH